MREARAKLTALVADSLQLQLRILHSTEVDPSAIASEHEAYVAIVDQLSKHPQSPHIQQFNDINEDEFIRVELEHIDRFSWEMQGRIESLCGLLQISRSSFRADKTIFELADRMMEPMKTGAANQFSESQCVGLLRVFDPKQYYGSVVAERLFTEQSTTLGAAATGENTAATAANTAASKDGSSEDEAATSLRKLKAGVIADRVAGHANKNARVLATALLQVKQWLAESEHEPIVTTGVDLSALVRRRSDAPALHVFSAKPKDMLFIFHGRSGTKAAFHWGLTNARLQRLFDESDLPALAIPQVSLLLIAGGATVAGSAYVTCRQVDGDATEQLALLIKALDFTNEYLRLANLGQSSAGPTTSDEDAREALLKIAEEL